MKKYLVKVPIFNLRTLRQFTFETIVEAFDEDHAEEIGELMARAEYESDDYDIGAARAKKWEG